MPLRKRYKPGHPYACPTIFTRVYTCRMQKLSVHHFAEKTDAIAHMKTASWPALKSDARKVPMCGLDKDLAASPTVTLAHLSHFVTQYNTAKADAKLTEEGLLQEDVVEEAPAAEPAGGETEDATDDLDDLFD